MIKDRVLLYSICFFTFCLLIPAKIFGTDKEKSNLFSKFEVNSIPGDSGNIRIMKSQKSPSSDENRNTQKLLYKLNIGNKIIRSSSSKSWTITNTLNGFGYPSFGQKVQALTRKIIDELSSFKLFLQKTTFNFKNFLTADLGNFHSEHSPLLVQATVLGLQTTEIGTQEDFLNADAQISKDDCSGTHNSNKNYSTSSAARLLSSMLKIGPDGLYSQFRCTDPHHTYIPEKARAVYKKSVTWWPQKSFLTKKITNDYLQCTAFVFMSYEMAGTPIIKKGRTNADDFLAEKYTGKNGQFNKFHSGETTELPKEGDVIVWSAKSLGNQYGHVGVVIEVRSDEFLTRLRARQAGQVEKPQKLFGTIRIANANSNRVVHEYQYTIDAKTQKVTLTKVAKDWAKVPDYWLRMR